MVRQVSSTYSLYCWAINRSRRVRAMRPHIILIYYRLWSVGVILFSVAFLGMMIDLLLKDEVFSFGISLFVLFIVCIYQQFYKDIKILDLGLSSAVFSVLFSAYIFAIDDKYGSKFTNILLYPALLFMFIGWIYFSWSIFFRRDREQMTEKVKRDEIFD